MLSVHSRRGDIVENTHSVSFVVVDTTDHVLASGGDPSRFTPARSAAKPFQAIPLVRDAANQFDVTDQEIALACASHNSEKRQVDVVRRFLERIGLSESMLACAPHRPLIKDLAYPTPAPEPEPELAPHGALASNCSGKHTGMLAVALANTWEPSGYHTLSHPVQRGCQDTIADLCEVEPTAVGKCVDGCGVVCWALPLRNLALGYARLGAGKADGTARIVRAMSSYPDLVAGHRRLCTALMSAYPGTVVAKVGAAGVYGATLPNHGVGIAIKVEDGNSIAAGVVLLALLEQLELVPDVRDRLDEYAAPAILNTRREVVGRYESSGHVSTK